MRNEAIRPGNELSLPVPEGTVSGDPVKVGGLVGVAATSRGEGGNIATHASVLIDGRVYTFTVDGEISGVGQQVYLTPRNGDTAPVLSTSGDAANLFGHTVSHADGTYATKPAAAGPALVKPLTV